MSGKRWLKWCAWFTGACGVSWSVAAGLPFHVSGVLTSVETFLGFTAVVTGIGSVMTAAAAVSGGSDNFNDKTCVQCKQLESECADLKLALLTDSKATEETDKPTSTP